MNTFITFEGGDGCGKTTQMSILHSSLVDSGYKVQMTFEPGGTLLGDKLRTLLKRKWDMPIAPETELLLFAASRRQLVSNVIKPALHRGEIVICDRFSDSTTAYQGFGRQLNIDTVTSINNFATDGLKPNLTILLDMPSEVAIRRKHDRDIDRFDSDNLEFHQRVRQGFLTLAMYDPERWLIIDAAMPVDQISRIIKEKVHQLINVH